MTEAQRIIIREYRSRGMSYTAIADALELPKATVTTFCRRNDLTGQRAMTVRTGDVCPQCGGKVARIPGRKPRKFCSAACRQAWWNAHPSQVKHKSVRTVRCEHCGAPFVVFGGSTQKYCSHGCYIAARFHSEDAV